MKKKPWLAALLNIVLSGSGYIYNGKRVLFGSLLLLAEVLGYAALFTGLDPSQFMNNWMIAAGVIWTSALAIDAYQEAKTV
jgi:hypothetical protein